MRRVGRLEQVEGVRRVTLGDVTVPVGEANRRAGLGFYQLYNRDQLPHHFVWRMLGEGTYVVDVEPSTNRAAGSLDALDGKDRMLRLPRRSPATGRRRPRTE